MGLAGPGRCAGRQHRAGDQDVAECTHGHLLEEHPIDETAPCGKCSSRGKQRSEKPLRVTNGAPWRFHEDVIQATTPAHRSRADRGNPLVIRATDHDIFPSTGTAASSKPGNCNDAQQGPEVRNATRFIRPASRSGQRSVLCRCLGLRQHMIGPDSWGPSRCGRLRGGGRGRPRRSRTSDLSSPRDGSASPG